MDPLGFIPTIILLISMSETIFQAIQLPEPNLTEFSISEIGPAKHHSSVFSTTFIA